LIYKIAVTINYNIPDSQIQSGLIFSEVISK
jgi:hypothetical protein